jgi:tetratricopeptide (TPR) repeat protein
MNNDPRPVENDIGLPFEDRIDILFQEIELAVRWDRPSILFAIYKSESTRNEVNSLLSEKLKNISQKTHSITTNFSDQFDFLSQISQLADLPQTVLLIDGFKWDCGEEGVRVFKEFNEHREYFIDHNIRAIFWLFENEVSEFASNATECWILRHRVVEFTDVHQQIEGSDRSSELQIPDGEKTPDPERCTQNLPEETMNSLDSENEKASHAKALLGLGMIFWRKGNSQRALKYLQTSVEISNLLADQSLQAQCQNALALVHTELGNVDEAISAYQHAISLSPESESLWNNLGQLLAKNERNEEAINAFSKALSCSAQDFLSWDGLGHIYNKFGVYQKAIDAFEKALEIAPYYEYSWAGAGKAYLESGQLEKAETALGKAVEINPELVDAWMNFGKCVGQQNRDQDAIGVYGRAIGSNPQDAGIWNELGKLQLLRQNYTESISAFQNVISLNPQFGEAYIRLAFALFKIGDYESSASIYEDSIPLFEDTVTRSVLWNRLGDTYLQMKDYEKAIAAYKESDQQTNGLAKPVEENPEKITEIQNTQSSHDRPFEMDDPGIERGEEMIEANQVFDLKTAAEWNEHGNSHLKAGAFNDAIVAYTKAIELAPNACWPYIQNLAYVHYQKGKARGKLSIGIIEDPDIWEGEDDPNSDLPENYQAISIPETNQASEEPSLEKKNSSCCAGQSPATTEPINVYPINPVPVESQPDQKNGTVLDPEENESDAMNGIRNTKIEVPQKVDSIGKCPARDVKTLPENSIDWNELGNSYAGSKKFDEAIEAYKKAIEMNPKFGQPYNNLGTVYYRLGKYDVSILLYKKSIHLLETVQEKAACWNRLGDAYRRVGDYGNASTAYKKSSDMVPVMSPTMASTRTTLLENAIAG